MSKKDLLYHLHNDIYCRLKPSSVDGVGIFAIRNIPLGIDPFKSLLKTNYYSIRISELTSLPEEVYKLVSDYCAADDEYFNIPSYGFNPLDILYYINHSKTPNVITKDGTTFYTLRDILKGEELTVDFRTYHDRDEKYL